MVLLVSPNANVAQNLLPQMPTNVYEKGLQHFTYALISIPSNTLSFQCSLCTLLAIRFHVAV